MRKVVNKILQRIVVNKRLDGLTIRPL